MMLHMVSQIILSDSLYSANTEHPTIVLLDIPSANISLQDVCVFNGVCQLVKDPGISLCCVHSGVLTFLFSPSFSSFSTAAAGGECSRRVEHQVQ